MIDHVDNVLALAAMEIAPRVLPKGWVACSASPDTLKDATAYFERTGKIAVSNAFSAKRLFANAECCQAFDAWHDHAHVTLQASFDLPGERSVNDHQQAQLLDWWKGSRVPVTTESFNRAALVLAMHNVGRLEYWLETNVPPNDLRSFANGYLTAKGLIAHHDHCPRAQFMGNEWTTYVGGV